MPADFEIRWIVFSTLVTGFAAAGDRNGLEFLHHFASRILIFRPLDPDLGPGVGKRKFADTGLSVFVEYFRRNTFVVQKMEQ